MPPETERIVLLVALITILNALANNQELVLEYRMEIGGVPINVFDILLLVGVLQSLRRTGRARDQERRPSLLFWAVVGAYFAVAVLSSSVAVMQNAPTRFWVAAARNYLALPASALIGHQLVTGARDYNRFIWILIVSGFSVSVLVCQYFLTRGAELPARYSIDLVRTVQYVTNYASLALCVVVFAEGRDLKLVATPVTVGLAAVCFVGQLATLSRSEWLATATAMAATMVLLPTRRRARTIRGAALGLAAVAAGVLITVQVASAVMERDFGEVLSERFDTMLPGEASGGDPKAWESRLPGAQAELHLWAESPVFGGGFGIQETVAQRFGYGYGSWRHNTFTSILAETGVVGILPVLVMIGAMVVLGRQVACFGANRPTTLIGALGFVAGIFYVVLGLATQSFNQMRFAIPLGMIFGMVMRAGGGHLLVKVVDPGAGVRARWGVRRVRWR